MEKTKVKIEVTEDDIKKGIGHNPSKCPIARAIKKRVHFLVTVGALISFADYHVTLPEEGRKFMEHFDDTGEGEPFSFEIEIPTSYLK